MNVRLGLLLLLATSSAWADWPEFRGPTANGLVPAAEAAKLPVKWSETENVAWKVELPGQGWATPVIQEGKVWIATAALDGTTFSVLALDEATGKVLLEKRLATCDNPEPLANKVNTYASCSPAAEKGRVYVHFGSYGTFCLDTTTFEVLWERRDLTCSHWRGPGAPHPLGRPSDPQFRRGRPAIPRRPRQSHRQDSLARRPHHRLCRLRCQRPPLQQWRHAQRLQHPYLTDVAGTPTIISPEPKRPGPTMPAPVPNCGISPTPPIPRLPAPSSHPSSDWPSSTPVSERPKFMP
ncbi:MAG: PQQ-binding-like beta-propeller repeat protein [Verrucomicrobiales bacterium]